MKLDAASHVPYYNYDTMMQNDGGYCVYDLRLMCEDVYSLSSEDFCSLASEDLWGLPSEDSGSLTPGKFHGGKVIAMCGVWGPGAQESQRRR